MHAIAKKIVAGAGSLLAVAAGVGCAGAVQQADAQGDMMHVADERVDLRTPTVTMQAQVAGTFSYTQGDSDPVDVVATRLVGASKYLCGSSSVGETSGRVASRALEVGGAVENPLDATLEELAQSCGTQTAIMGCSCAGNPTDGIAAVNAEVTGVTLRGLMDAAVPSEGANTVVFASADGYEVALPLSYLKTRHCAIVFDLGGAPLANSVGGTNQLWLGSTPASYFVRDVVSVTFEERQTPPPSPVSDEAREAYQNLPNVGVLFGGTVE